MDLKFRVIATQGSIRNTLVYDIYVLIPDLGEKSIIKV
jgi:hypothetical protein